MQLGKKQVLTVVKIVDFGVYLGSDEERVLLPKKQVPEDIEVGDPIEVFLYKDSSDRLIATTNEPELKVGELAVLEVADVGKFGAFLSWGLEKDLFLPFKEQTAKVEKGDKCLVATTNEPELKVGELAVLEVADVGKFGAFLSWGLEKDLFLPFKEQTAKVEKGDKCLVTLYIDKSQRLCATMKVYGLLRTDSPYKKDDMVHGIVYDTSDRFGVFVAVDNNLESLLP